MKSKYIRWLALFSLYVSLSSPAYAYLDPATGSIILQAIVGAVGTALIYYRIGVAKVRGFLSRIFNRKPDKRSR